MIKVFKNKEFKLHDSGLYVSKDGEVYVPYVNKYPAHFTYGCVNSGGYLKVGYKGKYYYVHILVAEVFIPNPDNLPTVDHENRNPSDNRVENLRWVDMSTQLKNREVPKNNAKSKPVYQYTLEGVLVHEWPSVRECGRNGFCQVAVAACCRGVYGKLGNVYKGFIWSYKPLFDM